MRICTVIVGDIPVRTLATDSFRRDSLICYLHGWGDSADRWIPYLALAESAGYGAVAIDWPGFGRTPRPTEAWGAVEYSRFLGDFLDKYAKDSKEVILVAHSMGARFALRYAVEHPERVSRMVFTGAAGIAPRQSPVRTLLAKSAGALLSLPGLSRLRGRIREKFSSSDYRSAGAMRDIFRRVIALDQRDEYALVRCPTLLLWGESDDQTPVADYQYMMDHIPDVRGRLFPGGHFFFAEDVAGFWGEIEGFIGRKSA